MGGSLWTVVVGDTREGWIEYALRAVVVAADRRWLVSACAAAGGFRTAGVEVGLLLLLSRSVNLSDTMRTDWGLMPVR